MKSSRREIDIIEEVRTLREIGERREIGDVSLGAVIKNVLSENKARASEKGIDIEYEDVDIKVRGGPLLEELFSNLLGNSIIHSGCEKIRIFAREAGEETVVTVEDDGRGIPDEDREKIFERGFKRGENAGSGLGMYLVGEIAESYQGSVKVKDSELGGAGFDVRLKRA